MSSVQLSRIVISPRKKVNEKNNKTENILNVSHLENYFRYLSRITISLPQAQVLSYSLFNNLRTYSLEAEWNKIRSFSGHH
jgi:hypothetical protein